jgi:hypothetical protein
MSMSDNWTGAGFWKLGGPISARCVGRGRAAGGRPRRRPGRGPQRVVVVACCTALRVACVVCSQFPVLPN